jgi:hypothetical protein
VLKWVKKFYVIDQRKFDNAPKYVKRLTNT